jgi:light-regulated signal transduction histidine kinase (bacteriophytochrome)
MDSFVQQNDKFGWYGTRKNVVVGSLMDIDFIKQKEIELQGITKELRKKNNELEKFAYITSHNLRAPVVNLISLTELQQENSLPQELQDEIRQIFMIVLDSWTIH